MQKSMIPQPRWELGQPLSVLKARWPLSLVRWLRLLEVGGCACDVVAAHSLLVL